MMASVDVCSVLWNRKLPCTVTLLCQHWRNMYMNARRIYPVIISTPANTCEEEKQSMLIIRFFLMPNFVLILSSVFYKCHGSWKRGTLSRHFNWQRCLIQIPIVPCCFAGEHWSLLRMKSQTCSFRSLWDLCFSLTVMERDLGNRSQERLRLVMVTSSTGSLAAKETCLGCVLLLTV